MYEEMEQRKYCGKGINKYLVQCQRRNEVSLLRQGLVSSDGGTKEQSELTSVGGVGLGTEDKMVENFGGRWEVPVSSDREGETSELAYICSVVGLAMFNE